MKHLKAINKYFWKYRWRFLFGIIFIVLSNYFKILAPQLTGFVIDEVQLELIQKNAPAQYETRIGEVVEKQARYDIGVKELIHAFSGAELSFGQKIVWVGIVLLALAILSGFFLFLMRQTIIVMSRHIEYDQKNEVFNHYLKLDSNFFKTHSTGDMMNRIAEDVSRVRMYTGPALMYFINLAFTIGFSVFFMYQSNKMLTLYVLAPLPLLAVTIYFVNTIINKKSERIQSLLSDLTTNAQESYSGIRVIKSFVQEKAMNAFFNKNAEEYKENAIGLAKVEAIYFPSMALLIGLSTLLTIMIGGIYAIKGNGGITIGTIAEFVMYVNMLTFPVSAIGWTASMIQRAAASQKRLNEFLHSVPAIRQPVAAVEPSLEGAIDFNNVDFIYPNTGIHALKQFNLHVKKGEKIAIIGHTGSGKTTIAQLLLRMYDPSNGDIRIDNTDIRRIDLQSLRKQISYVPQDVFLFSDTITSNISFGLDGEPDTAKVQQAARAASVEKEIAGFHEQYDTMIGERGVTLSGGQKQRISIARALIKDPHIVVFDDCLSAVDARTEKEILGNLNRFLKDKTAIIITHRIFTLFDFDQIIVMEEGKMVEKGTHAELLARNGYYSYLYEQQLLERSEAPDDN
ncbi:MAG: ABC transporter ATP-binding protein [Pseudobacter sp.]|uniref:ABC transporter ATP-binding protein n=1 Tax=Pseudobacter sp. TaxID=2045420 RepID=UPI003F7F2C01